MVAVKVTLSKSAAQLQPVLGRASFPTALGSEELGPSPVKPYQKYRTLRGVETGPVMS
jgi:hypothetical protein